MHSVSSVIPSFVVVVTIAFIPVAKPCLTTIPRVDDSIFYGKNRDTGIIAFSNNELNERIVNDIIAKKEMNCKVFKFIPYNTDGDLNTKWYKDGEQIGEEIERIPIKKYNIARCLK